MGKRWGRGRKYLPSGWVKLIMQFFIVDHKNFLFIPFSRKLHFKKEIFGKFQFCSLFNSLILVDRKWMVSGTEVGIQSGHFLERGFGRGDDSFG